MDYTFTNGIKGISFDSIKLHRFVPKGDGVRVFLVMRRTGSVQSKTGSIMSGGMDKIWLSALGVVDFSNDMKVLNEEVIFLKPDKILSKQYNLLDGEGKRITDMKTIATQDDCVKSNWDLIERYPELKEKEEIPEVVYPKTYYANSVNYTMLGGKLKAFESEKKTLKVEDPNEKKGFWDDDSAGRAEYEKVGKKKDMESYRNPTNKDYWSRMSDPVCDPISGNVYTHHAHIAYKTLGNRSNELEQEVVTFDKDGKELNRTEMKFKVPHALDLRQVLFVETPEEKLRSTDCIVHVYKQNYGFGYKKTNPNPDPSARIFYQWDADGNVISETEFKAPNEKAKVLRAFHNGKNVSLLAATGYKAAAFYTINFTDGKMTGTETCKDDCNLSKGIGFTPTEISGCDWEYTNANDQADGSKMVIYQLKKEVVVEQAKSIHSLGFVFFNIGKDGKIVATQHIKRSAKGNQQYKINFKIHPSDNGKYIVIVKDPLVGGGKAVDAYEIDGKTLEMKKVMTIDNAEDLSTKYLKKENCMVFFSKNNADNSFKIEKLKL